MERLFSQEKLSNFSQVLSESDLTVVMYFPELALDIQKQIQNFRCSQVHDVDVA